MTTYYLLLGTYDLYYDDCDYDCDYDYDYDYDDDDAHDAYDDDDAPTFLRALPSHPALAARRAPRRPASRAPRREVLFCRRGWSLPVRVHGGVAWPRRGGGGESEIESCSSWFPPTSP